MTKEEIYNRFDSVMGLLCEIEDEDLEKAYPNDIKDIILWFNDAWGNIDQIVSKIKKL